MEGGINSESLPPLSQDLAKALGSCCDDDDNNDGEDPPPDDPSSNGIKKTTTSTATTSILQFSTGTHGGSECTSLRISPSGRLVVAGFADGTLRLFPTAPVDRAKQRPMPAPRQHGQQQEGEGSRGAASLVPSSPLPASKEKECQENDNVSGGGGGSRGHRRRKKRKVPSSHVAAQIVSKGVHTSLLMDVDIAPDGLWAFAGVLRGSMELVAVHLGHLEQALDGGGDAGNHRDHDGGKRPLPDDWMDALTVYKHCDAKLRGFGACTSVDDGRRYLLLTGKAIKNIHIWSFVPPRAAGERPAWTQLYDTQTNGNTIKWLSFHLHPATGALSALSKSDGQKLRVWDLSREQKRGGDCDEDEDRPSRPPFVDVSNSEGMLGAAGGYLICGGASESMYHQVSLVNLDNVAELQSPYNHTELALPTSAPSSSAAAGAQPPEGAPQPEAPSSGRSRRQQRGDLKSVEGVAGISGQALLELSDGNLVQLRSVPGRGLPVLSLLEGRALPAGCSRQICVARVASCGLAVAATSVYNPNKGKGVIRLWPLESVKRRLAAPYQGYWGFRREPTLPRPARLTVKSSAETKSAPSVGSERPPLSAVKASSLQTAVSVQKEKPVRDGEGRSIVTPRFSDAVGASVGSAVRPSVGGRPRVSLEPVVLHAKDDGGASPPVEGLVKRKHPKAEDASDAASSHSERTQGKKRRVADGMPVREPSSANKAVMTTEPPVLSSVKKQKRQENASAVAAPSKPLIDARKRSDRMSVPRRSPAAPASRTKGLDAGSAPSALAPSAADNGFKSPMRRDNKKRSTGKLDDASQASLLMECQRQKLKLEQLLRERPSHRSRLLDSNQRPSIPLTLSDKRQELTAEHEAAHRRLAKTVLIGAIRVLDSVIRSPTPSGLNDARNLWTKAMASYLRSVEERERYQLLEIEALASQQGQHEHGHRSACEKPDFVTTESQGAAPSLRELQFILDQARDCLPQVSM